MEDVNRREVYRYLGYRGAIPDPEVVKAVESCLEELQRTVTPRCVFRRYEIERASKTTKLSQPKGSLKETELSEGLPQPPLLQIAGMEIRSWNLAANLRGCGAVYLMGATLGIGPDRLIARASVNRMSRAVIYQAAAAAMIEAWCDEVNKRIIKEAAKEALYCRPRFSPGYGDFSLEYQRGFAQILRLQKEIGVSLTESMLMMPSKSVTAIIGLSHDNEKCVLHGCEECSKAAVCAFSRRSDNS